MRRSPGVLLRLAPPSAPLPLSSSSPAALGALRPDTDAAPAGLDDELLSRGTFPPLSRSPGREHGRQLRVLPHRDPHVGPSASR